MYTLCLMPTLRNHFNSPSLSVIIIHVTKRYCFHILPALLPFFFFFNDTATTEIYTLSLHDALPIWIRNARYHRGDIVAFCAEHQDRFDAAFGLDFVEHPYDDQLLRIGRAIHGALKADGLLYLHTPNGEYFMERLRDWGVLNQIEGHVAVRDAASYEHLLGDCGFSD